MGKVKKDFVGKVDIVIVWVLLEEIWFDFVFVVGDLLDLYGIYWFCKEVVEIVLEEVVVVGFICLEVWFYCGVW